VAELTCEELYDRYEHAKALGVLPRCNIEPHEYWVR
jgi:hypothetical protein